jgi:transposase
MAARKNGKAKGPRMIKEILRLKTMGLGSKAVAAALGISKNTVKAYLRAHEQAQGDGVPGPVVLALARGDAATAPPYTAPWAPLVDWGGVKDAADRGVQLAHYFEEHVATSNDPRLGAVPYVTFWREFKRRFPTIQLDFHKVHPPGQRGELDYKGDAAGLGYIDRASGAFVPCRLFGHILCFSQLFYAQATRTEKQVDMLGALAQSFAFFGGVAHTTAVDNAKAQVTRAHRYDPDINPEFFRFAEHFGTAPLAMRPRKPKDKNLIENALGVFWRWAGPKIRQRTFFSLAELNGFIGELLDWFNSRIQKKYGQSRRQKFEQGEREKLLELPATAYEVGEWKKLKLHPDCHIQCGYNLYSAPYALRGKELDVRVTPHFVEIFHQLERVAIHLAASANHRGRYVTKDAHLPPAHLAMKEFTPAKALADAGHIGVATLQIVESLLTTVPHPLLHLRRVQGILRLAARHSSATLESACQVLVQLGVQLPRLDDVEGIIKNRSTEPPAPCSTDVIRGPNPNLRGQKSWSTEIH